jgi:hypothetical protein
MGRGRLFLIISVVAALLAVAAGAGAAAAGTTTTTTVRAVLSGHSPPTLRLRIIRDGRTLYDQLIRSRICGDFCVTTNVPPSRKPMYVGALQSGGDPAVVLGLFTGGAHCCFVDQVFSYSPTRHTYLKTQHDFLDAGARIQRLGGQVVFRSADARIAEDALTDYADSGAPVQIWRFARGRFVDVTRQYPALIRADAAQWMKAFNRNISNGVGFIAAWAADEYLLGNAQGANATLDSLARQHKLHSALGLPHNSQTAFVAALKKLLRELGYTK